jgi:hypothetical protein
MKKYSIILLLALPFLQAFQCKKNELNNPNTPTVLLAATVNDTSEVIKLGDTLKFTLTVPDTVLALSKLNATETKVSVASLQECSWIVRLLSIDTVNKIGNFILNDSSIYATPRPMNNYGRIYTSTNKPYTATLVLVPKHKGIYDLDFGMQETLLKINNGFVAGLRVNIKANNVHGYLLEPFFPGMAQAIEETTKVKGYGSYCFRVN